MKLNADTIVSLTGVRRQAALRWINGSVCPSWDTIHLLAPLLDDEDLEDLVTRAIRTHGPYYHTPDGVDYRDLEIDEHGVGCREIGHAIGVTHQRTSQIIYSALDQITPGMARLADLTPEDARPDLANAPVEDGGKRAWYRYMRRTGGVDLRRMPK